MQTAYKFKLHPNNKQIELLEDWQHKVGYAQNRSLGDRIATYNNTFVEGDYCDLYAKREVNSQYLSCNLETKALTSPLHCFVNKSASLGYPWKSDHPNLRRAKPSKDGKAKPFQPKRSADEMHSNWLTRFKQENPEYLTVNADVLQQSLRHVDTAFNKFFTGIAGFPNFKQHKDVGFEFKPGTVKSVVIPTPQIPTVQSITLTVANKSLESILYAWSARKLRLRSLHVRKHPLYRERSLGTLLSQQLNNGASAVLGFPQVEQLAFNCC